MNTPFDAVLAGFRLGESETHLKLEGAEHFQRATLALLQQARREITIVTPDLEPERFNNDEFTSALSAFLRSHRRAQARVLIADPTIAVRWGHRLVTLARRLPSRLRIRQLHEGDLKVAREELVIVADAMGLLRRDSNDGYQGSLAARAIPHAQRAAERFTTLWERSSEVADFRILDI